MKLHNGKLLSWHRYLSPDLTNLPMDEVLDRFSTLLFPVAAATMRPFMVVVVPPSFARTRTIECSQDRRSADRLVGRVRQAYEQCRQLRVVGCGLAIVGKSVSLPRPLSRERRFLSEKLVRSIPPRRTSGAPCQAVRPAPVSRFPPFANSSPRLDRRTRRVKRTTQP